MRPRRTVIAAVLLVTISAGAALAVTGDDDLPGYAQETVRVAGVREADGQPVRLDGTIYLPESSKPAPAVLLAHGYGGSKDAVADQAVDLARNGYVVLTFSARGFGRSGGKIHLNSPRYEVRDARAMIDLLGRRREVRQDAGGDPRVAAVGASYGGALSLLLAGTDPRIDAVVPSITWHDLRQALFPQFATAAGLPDSPAGVRPIDTPGVFKRQWAAVFLGSALTSGAARPTLPPSAQPSASRSAQPSAQPSAPAATQPSPRSAGPVAGASSAERARLGLAALETACGPLATDLCLGYLQTASTGRPTPELLDLLYRSSPARVVDRITAPTLLLQGQADSLFPISEADANARAIAGNGTPVEVVWGAGGHDGGTDESAREQQLTVRFLDRALRDGSRTTTGPGLRVTVPDALVSSVDTNPAPQRRSAAAYPGLSPTAPELARATLPLTGDEQLAIAPPGATPAAITALPGVSGVLGRFGVSAQSLGGAGGGGGLSALPGQVATFETAPLERGLTLTGSGQVTLKVTSTGTDATLFASLVDVGPNGATTLPQQLVSPIRLQGLTPAGRTVTVALPAVVQDVPAGHRLRVVLSTTDQAYALPQDARGYRISLAGDRALSLPQVPLTVDDESGAWRALLPGAIAILTLLGLIGMATVLTRLRTRRADRADRRDVVTAAPAMRELADRARAAVGEFTDPGEVPLVISGLGKAYGDGFRAVSDLSFSVQPGQVLGLLGPNGAGKTTTLRMLMGLIAPSEGEIRVFGHRIRPGAPVLSRVGAFVEGPGFLPHLSGLRNLELYWAATGRPRADAQLEVALEVAGLGDDVQRQVRTYSQGMRQRLAIAQAMLGLPELLVLDEPTNGLDPPQIREMREVLQQYAATGRTVLVSSHLLGEVEQTCTHVVVMARGRLVAQGPVAELVGQAGTLLLDVDRPAPAAAVAMVVPGVSSVAVTPTGLLVHAEPQARGPLVRSLVDAGFELTRMAPQRGLEETFLALVGEED